HPEHGIFGFARSHSGSAAVVARAGHPGPPHQWRIDPISIGARGRSWRKTLADFWPDPRTSPGSLRFPALSSPGTAVASVFGENTPAGNAAVAMDCHCSVGSAGPGNRLVSCAFDLDHSS